MNYKDNDWSKWLMSFSFSLIDKIIMTDKKCRSNLEMECARMRGKIVKYLKKTIDLNISEDKKCNAQVE